LPVKAEISDMPPWNDLSISLESHLAGFDLTKPINRLRTEISDRCREAASLPGGVYRLSVPTGGGKTLSSLRFALEHARLHNKERIFYIIPYTTIIDQNAAEIRRILKRDDLILEHHSNVIRENWPWDQNSEEDEADYNLLTEQWSSPIILTTMVQFLNSLYAGGTRAARSMHRLTNSVLGFDEVQATPVSCIHLLTGALNFLSGLCNTTVLLCTATQPELTEVERPLRILGECQIVGSLDDQFNIFKRNRVIDSRKDGGYTINDLSLFTIDKLSDLMTGLIILKTKDAARKLYLEIEQWNQSLNDSEQYNLFYLSTSLCPAHRKELLAEIQSLLHGGKVICISTQLIEAGIDISFQCVIRAVAGLDSIAQAAGRCNRHKEYEGCRDVFIVNLAGENLKHLPDMLAGRQAAEDILNNMKKDPALYGGDPVSPAAVRAYYLRFNQYVKGKMDYPVPDVSPNATLIDLLGSNKLGCHARCMRELPLHHSNRLLLLLVKIFRLSKVAQKRLLSHTGKALTF
jgi:CRISPR-associated endonuclease/helicase Cas3